MTWTWAMRPAASAANYGWVVAADQEVAGVQAPLHRRAIEDLTDVVGGLDERPGVRMQGVDEAVVSTQLVEPSASMPTTWPHRVDDSGNRGDHRSSTTTVDTNVVAPAAANSRPRRGPR